jgi:hypothetical protein
MDLALFPRPYFIFLVPNWGLKSCVCPLRAQQSPHLHQTRCQRAQEASARQQLTCAQALMTAVANATGGGGWRATPPKRQPATRALRRRITRMTERVAALRPLKPGAGGPQTKIGNFGPEIALRNWPLQNTSCGGSLGSSR